MNKIGWCDYTINPVKGLCPMACPYCYARRMYSNPYYRALYEHQEIRFEYAALEELPKEPARIFVGSTMELFGPWVEADWLRIVFGHIERFPQHTFIFLTKWPADLAKWSPFPKNCWVGFSATDAGDLERRVIQFQGVEAAVRFISFEPLLGRVWHTEHWQESLDYVLKAEHFNWIIIGQQTPVSRKTAPKVESVREIVEAADAAKVPVFLKDNLTPVTGGEPWAGQWIEHENQPPGEEMWWHPRQQFPRPEARE